jgi:methylated-DNA-[protein]-cysteine S-methyltransferase
VIVELASIPTPLGLATLLVSEAGILALDFGNSPDALVARAAARQPFSLGSVAGARRALAALAAYFDGRLDAIDALPVAAKGTDFQQKVWLELRNIPAGHTMSYGELARRIDAPKASRAVGAANGQNPVALVVPCHRVIGASGALTGYAGGLERKAWLLDYEARSKTSAQLCPPKPAEHLSA